MNKEILVPIYHLSSIREEDKGKFIERSQVSIRLLRNLHLSQIYTLDELLSTPYYQLKMIRNLGNQSFLELKHYVHQFGYYLLGEEVSLDEARLLNIPLLETLGFPNELCQILYSKKIFLLDDLDSERFSLLTLSQKKWVMQCVQYLKRQTFREL